MIVGRPCLSKCRETLSAPVAPATDFTTHSVGGSTGVASVAISNRTIDGIEIDDPADYRSPLPGFRYPPEAQWNNFRQGQC